MSAVAMNLPHCQIVFELAWLIPNTSTPNKVSVTVQSLVAQTIPFTLAEFEVIIQCGVTVQKSSSRDSRQVCGGAAVFAFTDVEFPDVSRTFAFFIFMKFQDLKATDMFPLL